MLLLGVAPRVADGFLLPTIQTTILTNSEVLTRTVVHIQIRTVEEHEPPTVTSAPVSGSFVATVQTPFVLRWTHHCTQDRYSGVSSQT